MSDQIREVFPYLRVKNCSEAIEFYKQAFGAEEKFRLAEPSGRVGHAELKFGSFVVMLSDEYPEYGIHGPEKFGGSGSAVHLHVEDVDAMTSQADSAGAAVTMQPTDMFYGERVAKVSDPYGHEWMLGSHIEDVSEEETQRKFNEMMNQDSDKR